MSECPGLQGLQDGKENLFHAPGSDAMTLLIICGRMTCLALLGS